MWDVLHNLLQRKDVIGDIGGYLTVELKLFLELRRAHETKVTLFNEFLLEYHHDKKLVNYDKLKKFVKDHSIFSKDTKNLTRSEIRLEKVCKRALKRKTLSLTQREALNNLVAFLNSSSFDGYKKVVLAQTLLLQKDFSMFQDHLQEFKALLEREGEFLKYELATLTQIEDRLSTLFKIEDPYRSFSAATLVSVFREIALLYGLAHFKVESVGSTGRGTGTKTSDYDIVIYVDQLEHKVIMGKPGFAEFLNMHLPDYYPRLQSVSNINFTPFRFVPAIGLMQTDGRVFFNDGSNTVIHLAVVQDEDDFQNIMKFQLGHTSWVSTITKKRKEQFLYDVSIMKDYFKILNLNSLSSKLFRGVMIETISRHIRFKRFADLVVRECLPWHNQYSIVHLKNILKQNGLTEAQIHGFFDKTTNDTRWDSAEQRAQRLIIACLRCTRGQEPGFDLNDFHYFYPSSFCVSMRVAPQRTAIQIFVDLTRRLFKVDAVQVIFTDTKTEVFFAFHGSAGTLVYSTNQMLLGAVQRLIKEPTDELKEAAFLEFKNRPPTYKDGIVEFYSVLFRYLK